MRPSRRTTRKVSAVGGTVEVEEVVEEVLVEDDIERERLRRQDWRRTG